MPTERNPKRQTPKHKEISKSRSLGGKNCSKMENFNIQLFFGVWTLAFEICPRQRAVV
jgi:hypothetical protein